MMNERQSLFHIVRMALSTDRGAAVKGGLKVKEYFEWYHPSFGRRTDPVASEQCRLYRCCLPLSVQYQDFNEISAVRWRAGFQQQKVIK
jgi:hypothetical protein